MKLRTSLRRSALALPPLVAGGCAWDGPMWFSLGIAPATAEADDAPVPRR